MEGKTKKINKTLKVFLITIFCLLILIIAYEVFIFSDGLLDTSTKMSKEEVIELLEKGKEYSNYYYSPENTISGIFRIEDENKTEIYVKDNIKKVVVKGNTLQWDNYNTNETITIMGEYKGKNYASIGDLSSDSFQENSNSQMGFDYSLIADEEHFNYNFKYLGKKEIDGRSTVLVKVWSKNNSEMFATKFLIDEQTGLITKRIDYTMYGILLTNMICDRNVKLDIVTDQDVERPDLSNYEILK